MAHKLAQRAMELQRVGATCLICQRFGVQVLGSGAQGGQLWRLGSGVEVGTVQLKSRLQGSGYLRSGCGRGPASRSTSPHSACWARSGNRRCTSPRQGEARTPGPNVKNQRAMINARFSC